MKDFNPRLDEDVYVVLSENDHHLNESEWRLWRFPEELTASGFYQQPGIAQPTRNYGVVTLLKAGVAGGPGGWSRGVPDPPAETRRWSHI